jgi:hypothetical protein
MGLTRATAALIAVSFLLGACASQPEIPFDHASAGEIKAVGIVTPRFPHGPTMFLNNSVGKSLAGSAGLIGAVIGGIADASLQQNRETKFTSAMSDAHYSAQDAFLSKLSDALASEGYTVSMVSALRPDRKYLDQYPASTDPRVDAYLDIVVFDYGYAAAGRSDSTPWRPYFSAGVKLVRAKDSSLLMEDAVVYNPVFPYKNAVTIAPDPAYGFVDFDTLTANQKKAVDGLSLAVQQSAETVAKLLK